MSHNGEVSLHNELSELDRSLIAEPLMSVKKQVSFKVDLEKRRGSKLRMKNVRESISSYGLTMQERKDVEMQ